jgi:hypothetical protein
MWTEDQIRMMIDERKNNNAHYHKLFEGKRRMWWNALAVKINLRFGTHYIGRQVNEKFQSIVRDVHVSKIFKFS